MPAHDLSLIQIDVRTNAADRKNEMISDVRRGLTARQKYLLPKYFYDARGSDLFDQICELPEYYVTRVEHALLESIAAELLADFRPVTLVELGSGSATKTRVLLRAMVRNGGPALYVPLDVSETATRATARDLVRDYTGLRVHAVIMDFHQELRLPVSVRDSSGPRLFTFLGSTLGNFTPTESTDLLSRVARCMDDRDRFLLGVDLVKRIDRLEAAYNDTRGVTARFNRNVLEVINAALGGNFVPHQFNHTAFYNREASQIEMHLASKMDQKVAIRDADLVVPLAAGETIRTEISRKFTGKRTEAMLRTSGLEPVRWMTDPEGDFGLSLSRPIASDRLR